MKTQYYKLVKKVDDHYTSAIKGCLKYRLNRWTYPKPNNHPFLFVFNSRAYARDFKRRRMTPERYVLFKCDVKNPTETRSGLTASGKPFGQYNWPEGTRFADTVKLTERTH